MLRSRLLPLLTLLCWLPCVTAAAPRGTALVIGIGTYDNKPLLPACIATAHAVSAHLRTSDFAVTELIDPGGIVLRSAVGDFADAVLSQNPTAPALIYVCARAATLDHRIFLLPADATPEAMLRLQTEGIVLRALMNTFAGSNGMLVADLGMSAKAADVTATAQDRPDALHVALRAGAGDRVGSFGKHLAVTPLDMPAAADGFGAPWNRVATALQTAADTGPGVAVAVTPPAAVVAQKSAPPPSTPEPAPPYGLVAAPPSGAAPLPPGVTAMQLPPPAATSAATPTAAAPSPPPPAAPATTTVAAANPAPPPQQASASQPPPRPAPPSHIPQAHADSRTSRIQEALARRGFYHGPVDGVSTPRTVSAIRAFQVSLGDSPTGGLTQIEVVKLLNVW
jgi:Putative peptidoglycan binding domain